jgi:hypothetical protein
MPLGSHEPQAYPPARGTHEQVCADPDLFQDTLRELYDALDIKVAKVMKLGGQELNLHLLYQRVCWTSACCMYLASVSCPSVYAVCTLVLW